jgi:hypothetical protein
LDDADLWADTKDAWYGAAKAWARAFPDQGAYCEDPEVGTVFTPAYRLLALDLDNPQIAEGLRITLELSKRLHSLAERNRKHLFILLIPTKELVYAEAGFEGNGRRSTSYSLLTVMERKARSQLIDSCERSDIPFVDALSPLADALRNKVRIYPYDTESHPNRIGYSILAETCHKHLQAQGM